MTQSRSGAPGDAPLSNTNEMVYDLLKREILSNRLRPGSKLVHQALAESFGVSRTPVRESLERLYQEGLLLRVKNRGYFVAEIDAREVAELYQTRLALEMHALNRLLAGDGLAASDLAALARLHAEYEASIGVEHTRQRTVIDREFHLALARMSGNQYLCRMLEGIFERLMLKRRVDGYNDSGEDAFQEHSRLVVALKEEDGQTALDALKMHIEHGQSRLIRHLATLTDGQ